MARFTKLDPEQIARGMAQLSAGLRSTVPVTDEWQVQLLELSDDVPPMIEVRFARVIDEKRFNLIRALSPWLITDAAFPLADFGVRLGYEWKRTVDEAISSA